MTAAQRFSCTPASLQRGEPIAGTATHVRTWLLLEHSGPWGQTALRDARLPDGLGAALQQMARHHKAKVLLIRRPRSARDPDRLNVFAAYSDPVQPRLEHGTVADAREVLDLDLERATQRWDNWPRRVPRPDLLRVHPRPPRRVLRRVRATRRSGASRRSPGPHVGGVAHRRRPFRRQHGRLARRSVLRPTGPHVSRRRSGRPSLRRLGPRLPARPLVIPDAGTGRGDRASSQARRAGPERRDGADPPDRGRRDKRHLRHA